MTTIARSRRHSALRRLLQLDQPVAERSEAELTAEMYKNYRWNFTTNFLDGAFFWFGLSFISATTILPLFVSKLTTSAMAFALLAILGQASWYLPQLFAAGATERVARKKPIVINLGFLTERLPVWLLPVAALISVEYPIPALVLFFVAYAWHGLGAGIIAPAWSDMLARCFPVQKRGRFFGITSFVGTGLGALGAVFSGWLLVAYPFPLNFAYAFGIAAASITLSWFFLAFVREPARRIPDEVMHDSGQSGRKIRKILNGDTNFRNYLIARFVSSFSLMAAGFVTVAAIQRWQVLDSAVGGYTAALLIGQTAGNLLAGVIADRYGHKLSLELGLISTVGAFLLAWLVPTPDWLYLVFLLLGAGMGISIVSGVLIPLEFSLPEHRPTYVGLSNTTLGIGSVAAPLIGGLIATWSYNWLFLISATIGLVALTMMHYVVKEPRGQSDYFDARVGRPAEDAG